MYARGDRFPLGSVSPKLSKFNLLFQNRRKVQCGVSSGQTEMQTDTHTPFPTPNMTRSSPESSSMRSPNVNDGPFVAGDADTANVSFLEPLVGDPVTERDSKSIS